MDREVENATLETAPKRKQGYHSGHLMCRTPLWGLAGFIACSYFTWVSFAHVMHDEYEWPHDWWTAITYIVWIVLLVGLAFDTRCLRERFFFGILVINFVAGFAVTLMRGIPSGEVRGSRIGTGALWALAALVSLTTLRGAPELKKDVATSH